MLSDLSADYAGCEHCNDKHDDHHLCTTCSFEGCHRSICYRCVYGLIFKRPDSYHSNIRCPNCNRGHFTIEGIDEAINRETELIEDALRIQADIWNLSTPPMRQMKGLSAKNYLQSSIIDPACNDVERLAETTKLYKTMIKNFGRILSSAEYEVLDVDQDVSMRRLSLELARLTAIYQRKLHSSHMKLILGPLDRIRINGVAPKRCYHSAEQLRAASTEEGEVQQLQRQLKSQQQYLQHIELMLKSKDEELKQAMRRLLEEHNTACSACMSKLDLCRRELESKNKLIIVGVFRERCLKEKMLDYKSRVDQMTALLESIHESSTLESDSGAIGKTYVKGEVGKDSAASDHVGEGIYSVETNPRSTSIDGVEALGSGLDDTHTVVAAIDTMNAPNNMVVKTVHGDQVNTTTKIIATIAETIAFTAQTKNINDGEVINDQAFMHVTQIEKESMMIGHAPRSGAAIKRKIIPIENTEIPMGGSSISASKKKVVTSDKVMLNEKYGEELFVASIDSDKISSSSNSKKIRREGELETSSSSTGFAIKANRTSSSDTAPAAVTVILDTADKCTTEVHTDRSTEIISVVSEFKKKHHEVLNGGGFRYTQLKQLLEEMDRDNEHLNTLVSTFLVVEEKNRDLAMDVGMQTVQWLIEAVELSHSRYLQYNLGFYYEHGLGVDVNYLEAVRMYKLSVKRCYGPAMGRLGYCYLKGYGMMKPCNELALKYLKMSVNTVKKLECQWGNTIQRLEKSLICSAPHRFMGASSATTQEEMKRCVYHPKSKSHWTEDCRDVICRPLRSSGSQYFAEEEEEEVDEYCDRRGEYRFMGASSATTQEEMKRCIYHPKSKSHWTEDCRDVTCRPLRSSGSQYFAEEEEEVDEYCDRRGEYRFMGASSATTQEEMKRCIFHPKSKSHWTEDCRDVICRPLRSNREVLVLPEGADEGYHDPHIDEGYHDCHFSSDGLYSAEEEGEEADEYCDRRGATSSYRNYDRLPINCQLRTTR